MFLFLLECLRVVLVVGTLSVELCFLFDFVAALLQKLAELFTFFIVKLILTHRQLPKVNIVTVCTLLFLTFLLDYLKVILEPSHHIV